MGGVFSSPKPTPKPAAGTLKKRNRRAIAEQITNPNTRKRFENPFANGAFEPANSTRRNKKPLVCRYPGCGRSCTSYAQVRVHEKTHEALPTVPRSIKTKPVTPRTVLSFIESISTLPIYIISAHSCICMDSEICYGVNPPHTFNLPKRTYILNLAQPGDYVLSSSIHDIARNIPAIRQYLYLHGADDFVASPEIGETHFALFSGAQRAVGPSEYPNITYTLNSYDGDENLLPPNKNISGVFKLSGSMIPPPLNVFSILPQDGARQSWTLQQIIREVYEKEGISSALFISAGCLVPCLYANEGTPTEETVQRSVGDAARLMHIAHNEYTSIKPVVTASELVKLGTEQFAEPIVLIPPAVQTANNALRMYPDLIGAEPFLDPLTISGTARINP